MRAWLLRAPWWVHSMVSGGFFGLLGVVNSRFLRGDGWGEAVVTGVLGGVAVGAVMGPFIARLNRRYRAEIGEEHVDRLVATGWRGRRAEVGDDPELRAAARRATLFQRDQLLSQRRWAVPFFVLVIGLDVWLAVARSPWWLLAGAFFVAMAVGHLVVPRRLERRAEELAGPAG